jgi:hypothetical protein
MMDRETKDHGIVLAAMIATILMASLPAGPVSAEVDRGLMKAEMREIFTAIEVLLPLSVDEDGFRSPEQRDRIRAALSKLASRADGVATHGAGKGGVKGDRRIEYLGSSLARDTKETLQRFDEGRIEGAQFFLQRLTNFCVACHSRLPDAQDSPLARDFMSDQQLARLPAARRASLQVATRRFDDALTTYESLFASKNAHPAELLGPLTQYLTVAIRVKDDLARPIPVLQKLSARADLWANLEADLAEWIRALNTHASSQKGKPTLESARALLDEAREIIRYPSDRKATVHYLLASSGLHRYLEAHSGEQGRDLAEAYYLLGLIETRININYWVYWEADFYLETAIRLAPTDPIAERAFILLEEETVLGWTGSAGSSMPEDVRRNLEELRALVYPAD